MRKLNPFANIPTLMRADAIIEFAHRKSKKLSRKSSLRITRQQRAKIREIARVQEFVKQVKTKLKIAVEDFPSLDQLHPFYRELAEIIVGTDKLKQSLGSVYNCIPPINAIADDHIEALKLAEDPRKMKRLRSAAKGRIASIVRGTAENLEFIIEAKSKLARLPGVSPLSPTLVCAGFPNVGKSTLVRGVSTATPEIAYYPFTTKEVIVGHLTMQGHQIQIVDTPGILDRPMSDRNEIEREAIAALKYLAQVIVFLLDPSEACGWSIDEQINLYNEVRRMFPLSPIIIAFNKVDITPPDHLEIAREKLPGAIEIVATEGEGVDVLMKAALDEIDVEPMQQEIDEYLESLREKWSGSRD
ncbi:GTP-binding protein [Candidatus Thorarchaeota archaeon]|nr:MAG: GTP-binding protein [Candidatus Thorarchaeota archaeon]